MFLSARRAVAGFTLLEVLITLIVLAIGMLGLANLQSKIHITEVESYQRAHAVLLLQDMVNRLNANSGDAFGYVSATVLGTEGVAADCDAIANIAARDRCLWQEALLGASEQSGGANVGAMIGARGCIEELQKADPTSGVCTPGIYRISVAWQGLHKTAAPADELTCGADEYGDEALRRIVSATVTIGEPGCP